MRRDASDEITELHDQMDILMASLIASRRKDLEVVVTELGKTKASLQTAEEKLVEKDKIIAKLMAEKNSKEKNNSASDQEEEAHA